MKEIRQQKKQPGVIRKRILEQATILVSQKGISGVSIQNIATAVGITKGGVFHHFPNKKNLIEEMFNQIILDLDQTVEMPASTLTAILAPQKDASLVVTSR